tara:strand:+ start:31 stop:411 length:381 start_codon:yes stop_codon:yes gene_type:complete
MTDKMKNWLENIHTQEDCWEKTMCPLHTEIYTFKDDDGYNESRGGTYKIDNLEVAKSETITVERVEIIDTGKEKSRWSVEVEIFVYKDYLYTLSKEHIRDAFGFSCWTITRRPLTIDYRKAVKEVG